MSEKRLSMQRWNFAGALYNLNGIRLYANLPNGQVKVIFSWSSGAIGFDCILNIHPENNNIHVQLVSRAFGL